MRNRVIVGVLTITFALGGSHLAYADAQGELDILSFSEQLSDNELDDQRGGSHTINIDDLNFNIARANGNVAGNVANGVFTGTSNIDRSFNEAQGVFSIINNFGANSLIQDVMIINIELNQ